MVELDNKMCPTEDEGRFVSIFVNTSAMKLNTAGFKMH
jgi:hypothetical protein